LAFCIKKEAGSAARHSVPDIVMVQDNQNLLPFFNPGLLKNAGYYQAFPASGYRNTGCS
jgi:hypothetical protein